MHNSNLRNVDLNLLKILSEIERAGSVSGAAEALGVGQPAVSQALSRLRETFKDDLFVRAAGGMKPTPRLQELIGPIQSSLDQIERSLFGAQDFDPETTDARFVIGSTDYAAALLTPKLMQTMKRRMPGANLTLLRADKSDAMRLLNDGKIDLGVGLLTQKDPWIRQRKLFDDSHVCVFNPGLLPLCEPMTMEDYLAHDHLLVSLDGSPEGFVDGILKKQGRQRRIACVTPFFLQCAYLLEKLPLIATLPRRFVRGCSTLGEMARCKPPFDVPRFDVSVAWRASDDRSPRANALKQAVLECARDLLD